MKNQVRNFNSFIKEEANESRRHRPDVDTQKKTDAEKKIQAGLLALINSFGADDMVSKEEYMRTVNRIADDYYGHVGDMRRF
jgi:hypothetical protein